jgi:hypothetical protein
MSYIASNGGMAMNGELKEIWKEEVEEDHESIL